MVVNDTYTAPEVRYRVCVFRVIRQIFYAFCQVRDVGDQGQIQFLEHAFVDQSFDHVIGRNQHVIGIPSLQFGVHGFVGIEVFHDNLYAEFFFKIGNQVFAHVFAPVVELQGIGTIFCNCVFRRCTFAAAAAAACQQHYACKSHSNQFFHTFFLLFSLMMGTTLTTINTTVMMAMTKVDNALMEGLTRLLMVYTKIEILFTPLPVTK